MTKKYYASVKKTEFRDVELEFYATSEEDAKLKALKLAREKHWSTWEDPLEVFDLEWVEEDE